MAAYRTLKEQLIEVQDAISRLLTGAESVSIDGISYKYTSLQALQNYEQVLIKRINAASGRSRYRTYPDFS